MGTRVPEEMEKLYTESIKSFEVGSILKGRVLAITPTEVIVDGGYKSEGAVPSEEFEDLSEVKIGDEIEVLLEAVEADSGLIRLSKRKADRIRGWERIVTQYKEGDVVKGRVMRKIKGGLLVDLGIPVFLPASQIDIKLPGINGVETFKEIKKINPAIAVIMMTAYSVDELMRESIAEGAYASIYKPFDPEKILKIIKDAIEKRPKPAGDYHG